MTMAKVSLICTVKNDESSMKGFLDSLLSQSRPPDEIIIVDGGSTDRTVEIIKSYVEKGSPIKLIVKEGVNIAKGRNIAIGNSRCELIASTDAGCRIDKNWLKNLIEPFELDQAVDVVSGWYEPDASNEFEKSVAEVTFPKIGAVLKNPDDFLPSGRSIAFKKSAWEKVGGYPEWLTFAGEDTLFDINLKKAGFKFAFAPKAVVYWKMRPNLKSFFKQYYLYAKGDREAGLFTGRYLKMIFRKYAASLLFIALGFKWSVFFALFFIGVVFYWAYIAFRHPRYPFRAAIIMILKESAQILGWLSGKRLLI
ncbi:MAG: glycosyltransferase [Candidatus Omnitrophota bacterium]